MTKQARTQAVEQYVSDMAEARGWEITPEDLVEDAKSTDSPLHALFEWDDAKAAHSFRVEQARAILRRIRFPIERGKVSLIAPFYLRNPDAEAADQGYVALPKLLSDEDLARRAVAGEIQRAVGALRRAAASAASCGLSARTLETMAARAESLAVGLGLSEVA